MNEFEFENSKFEKIKNIHSRESLWKSLCQILFKNIRKCDLQLKIRFLFKQTSGPYS